jgi:cystathionine beta-synthase
VGRFARSRCPTAKVGLADPVGSRLWHLVDPSLSDHDGAYQVQGIEGRGAQAACDLSSSTRPGA